MNYSDYFVLSDESPSGLKWKVNKGRSKVGDNAITAISGGYYKGRLNQKNCICAQNCVCTLLWL